MDIIDKIKLDLVKLGNQEEVCDDIIDYMMYQMNDGVSAKQVLEDIGLDIKYEQELINYKNK